MNSNLYLNNIKRKSVKRGACGSAGSIKVPLFVEYILALIDKLLSVRISPRVKGLIKVSVSVVCVVCFIGVIGSIEAGALSFAKGIIWGLILTFIEILALKD